MVIRRFRSNNNEIFVITDTFFNFKYTSRDYSKFKFKGHIWNKSRLVNQVLKAYIEDNESLSYAELEKIFPISIQGNKGVFTTNDEAQDIFDKTGHKRYYIKPDELIKVSDEVIATSTQWGIDNIKSFIKHVNKLNWKYKIENQ